MSPHFERQSLNTPKNNAHLYMTVSRCISIYCIYAPCTPHQKGYTVHLVYFVLKLAIQLPVLTFKTGNFC